MHRPFVVLVGSFADQQRPASLQEESGHAFAPSLASSMQQPMDNGKSVLRMVVEEFGNDFVFIEYRWAYNYIIDE